MPNRFFFNFDDPKKENVQKQFQDETDLSSIGLLSITFRYRKPFIIIGLAAAVLAMVFSGPFFITPLFKSTVILYPTSSNSISKVLLSTNFNTNKDLLEIGEDEQTERMLQILNSNKIRDRIIQKYDLMKHYEIRPGSEYRFTRLYDTYESNIKFRRTEYMAVKITVLDKDPRLASLIANDIAELFDSTMNMMQKEVASKAFVIVENEYLKLKSEVKAIEDSLNAIRRLGIHDYESQAEMLNQQLAIELAKNNKAGISALEERLKVLAQYGGAYVSLRDMLEHERKQLSQIKAKFEEAKVDATQVLPHKFVVTNAYEAEKKAFPIRWLITLIAVISSMGMALIIFVAIEKFSSEEVKKKLFSGPSFHEEVTSKPSRKQ